MRRLKVYKWKRRIWKKKSITSSPAPRGKPKSPPRKKKKKTATIEAIPPSVHQEEKRSGTVYCEGISYDASEGDVAKLFGVEVSAVRMPRYQDSGKIRGYAHVDVDDVSAAVSAVHGADLMGRYLTVTEANEIKKRQTRPRPSGCRTLFVKNLPYDTNVDAVRNVFRRHGKIQDVRLPLWQHTKRLKGHGYVQFVREYDAEQAFDGSSDLTLKGRRLYVDYAEDETPRASFRTADGRPWAKTRIGKSSSSSRSHSGTKKN